MKRLKTKYYIVLLLACLSLISVGFSSWIISDPAYEEIEGIIEVDNVVKTGDCISAEVQKTFDFYAYAFTHNNENNTPIPTKTGILEYKITIDLDNCSEFFLNSNKLILDFTLNHDFYDYSNNCINIKPIIENNGNTTEYISTNNINNNIITTYNINNFNSMQGQLVLTLKYEFEISNMNNYNNLYINKLKNLNNLNFGLSAKITGVME